MRLTFLCSSIEKDRDGVGDYTRTLAAELRGMGAECTVAALDEPSLDSVIESESELRFPRGMEWEQRIGRLNKVLKAFSPDWLSLQFSPYGFHAKGLPFSLPRHLRLVLSPYRLQVMLHELWIGADAGSSWRNRIYGIPQKQIILKLLRSLGPALIQTSNPVYQTMLAVNGVSAEILPLFGNIPIIRKPSGSWWTMLAEPHLGAACCAHGRRSLWIGMFGSIHPEWYPKRFLDELVNTAEDLGLHPILAAIGWAGPAGIGILQRIACDYGGRLSTLNLGEQPAGKISEFLQGIDFAIAASPWALTGKSGTVAAMLDHGLPVAVPRDDWKLRNWPTPSPAPNPLLFQPECFLTQLRRGLQRAQPRARLPEIAGRFLHSLSRDKTKSDDRPTPGILA